MNRAFLVFEFASFMEFFSTKSNQIDRTLSKSNVFAL